MQILFSGPINVLDKEENGLLMAPGAFSGALSLLIHAAE
jgi:hypothetical protein